MQIGRNDWNAKLVAFFFNKTRLVILLLTAIVIGGLFSLSTLRREGFPEVKVKIVGITTVFPGASATEVESQVTKPIEEAVKDLDKVKEVSSTSQTNVSTVIISFDEGASIDVALQDVRGKISSVESELPEDAVNPLVQTFSTGGSDFIIGITDDLGLKDLKSQADLVSNELSGAKGVKSAKALINHTDRLKINYDQKKLFQNNLTVSQVDLIIKGSNIDFPLATTDIDDKQQSIIAQGAYTSLEDIKNQIIGQNGGKPIKLTDVASITVDLDNTKQLERIGFIENDRLVSKTAILLGVEITKDADIIKVKDEIDKKIEQIKKDKILAADTKIVFLLDQSESTARQIGEILSGALGDKSVFYLLGGVQLVVLAMLLFVNWRAAIVASLAIPISFLITLFWLYLTGVALNTIVLFSLVLVLGLIVDPAIVILESIQRYKELGRSGREAVMETASRYGAGIFIAVLTSILVFIPFGIVSGIFGEIIKYIPITIIPALVASYLVPMAILPVLAAKFLKGKMRVEGEADEEKSLWLPAKWMIRFNLFVLGSFWRKILVLIVISVAIFLSLQLVIKGAIPIVQFSSPEDNENLLVTMQFPKGETFSGRDNIAAKIENRLVEQNGIKNYFYFGQDKDQATLYVTLKEKKNREKTSKEIISDLNRNFASMNEAFVDVKELSVGPPSADYPIQAQLFDNDLGVLEKGAKDVGAYLKGLDQVEKVDDGFTDKGEPELRIIFDKTRLSLLGLSVFEIDQFLKSRLDEQKVTKFNDIDKDQTLEVFIAPDAKSLPKTKQELEKLQFPTRTGGQVALSSVAKVEERKAIDKIERFAGSRFVNVRAKLKSSDDLAAVQSKLDSYLTDKKLRSLGLDSKMNRGEFEEIAKSFRELGMALAAAIFLTYFVLVLQFNSFSQPIIMLFTIPLSLIGVLPALLLVGGQMGFLEIIGFTMLVGIVENVAIFLIDYANQLVKERGISLKEAIAISSGVRFRPIILTKVVALGGLLPLAVFSPFWRGLSAVTIGGILVSGFFSMIVIPIFYTWFGAVRNKIHKTSYE